MPVAGRPKGAQSPAQSRAMVGRTSAAGAQGLDTEQVTPPGASGAIGQSPTGGSPSPAPHLAGLSHQEEQGWRVPLCEAEPSHLDLFSPGHTPSSFYSWWHVTQSAEQPPSGPVPKLPALLSEGPLEHTLAPLLLKDLVWYMVLGPRTHGWWEGNRPMKTQVPPVAIGASRSPR